MNISVFMDSVKPAKPEEIRAFPEPDLRFHEQKHPTRATGTVCHTE